MRTAQGIAVTLWAGFLLVTADCAGSSLLYVTSYPNGDDPAGKLTALNLGQTGLEPAFESLDCGTHPSWLTQADDILYCVDEAWPRATGNLTSLQIGTDGTVTKLSSLGTLGGPVNTVVYGYGGRGLAVADYAGGGINTFNIADPAAIAPLQTEVFPAPGDNLPNPQEQARPHEAILDPTGNYLVFPDLGADLLRVFKVDKATLKYTELKAHELARGTGPRHGVFLTTPTKTFLYVVNELSNSLTGFAVTYSYNGQGLSFTQVYNATSHGDTNPVPSGSAAAEIALSPDHRFLTVSSRNEASMQFTLANGTTVPSDPLITFSINTRTGALTRIQTAPAGGIGPRHFSLNADGTLVASALQSDGRVVVFERDTATGLIGKAVAEANVYGQPNFARFKQ
ncbi:hypothetical protein VTK56DRAFT_2749 [Thermocarpiscus australiensis]